MSITIITYYYLIASIFLYIGAHSSKKLLLYSPALALGITILPSILPTLLEKNSALPLPLTYIPFIASGLAFFRKDTTFRSKFLFYVSLVFIFYSFATTLILGITSFSSLLYWMSWLVNLLIFFSVSSYLSITNRNEINSIIHKIILVLIFGCLLGIAKYFLGISEDSNFISALNRNGTAFIIVLMTPFLFYLYEAKKLTKNHLILFNSIIFLSVIFLLSRSAILAYIFVLTTLLLLNSSKRKIVDLLGITLVFLIFLALLSTTEVYALLVDKFTTTYETFTKLNDFSNFTKGDPDSKRVFLISASLDIIKNNFWLGTGLGLENYREAFHSASDFYMDSKPHNFYLSYFSELGFFGFSLLMAIFYLIYRNINKSIKPFKAFFMGLSFLLLTNEYILLPLIWILFGLLAGSKKFIMIDDRR